MKKLTKSVLALAALSVSSLSFAGSEMDTRIRELESQIKDVRGKNASDTYGAFAKTARPTPGGGNFFLTADVLYWQVNMDGTAFAYTNGQTNTVLPSRTTVNQINFSRWDWGFRVGAGYNFKHGDFDVYANYTYYRNRLSGSAKEGVRAFDVSQPVANIDNFSPKVFYSASSNLKYNFNRVDLELGRNFFVSNYFSMRPHAGLTASWISLEQRTTYSGEDVGLNSIYVNNENHFWGVGPRAGVNAKWHLCNDFSIINNLSGAFSFSEFDLKRTQFYSVSSQINNSLTKNCFHRITPNAQMQFGVAYDNYDRDCNQHFSAFLVWDIQYWWNLNRTISSTQYLESENLYMQGATLSLRMDF